MDDSVAIYNLISLADRLATKRDIEGYINLFAPNAIITGIKGIATGRVAISKMVSKTWAAEKPDTIHLTTNLEITNLTTDKALAASRLIMIVNNQIVGIFTIKHHLVKNAAGWQFTERQITS